MAGTLTWGPWIGAPTPDGVCSIKAKVVGATSVSLKVATNSGMTGSTTFGPVTPDALGIVAFTPTGLASHTQHYCVLSIDGVDQTAAQGKFRTAPAALTPANMKLVFSSCSGGLSGPPAYSNHASLDAVAAEDPDLFLHLGDISYADPTTSDPATFADQVYNTAFAQPKMGSLLRTVPWGYMWSDHDSGPNGDDETSATRLAARNAYRRHVPHPPLLMPNADTDDTVPPYHEIAWGRVRIFMPDSRLERDVTDHKTSEEAGRTRWGAAQKAFLKQRMLAARESLLILNTEGPWIAKPEPSADHWAAYTQERQEICQWLVDNNLHTRTVIIEGDGHFLAMDDGIHNYAGCGVPVFNGAPLDRGSLSYSGPYTQGLYQNPAGTGNYVVLDIQDPGGKTITVNGAGINITATGTRAQVMSLSVKRGPLSLGTYVKTPAGLVETTPKFDPATTRPRIGDALWLPAASMYLAGGTATYGKQSVNNLDAWSMATGDTIGGTFIFPRHVKRVRAVALLSKSSTTATGSGRLVFQHQHSYNRNNYSDATNRANEVVQAVNIGTDQATTQPTNGSEFVPPAQFELFELSLADDLVLGDWQPSSLMPGPMYRFAVIRTASGDTYTASILLHGLAFLPYG